MRPLGRGSSWPSWRPSRRPLRRPRATQTRWSSSGEHPIVNCADLSLDRTDPRRQRALDGIRGALRTRGYFYAQGVPSLPESYIREIYDYLERLHALPVPVKRRFASENGVYSGPDVGVAELAYEPGSTASVCAWDYTRSPFSTPGSAPTAAEPRDFPGADVIDPPFSSVLDRLYERQNAFGGLLLTAFAEMLGLPPDTFAQHYGKGDMGTIRLLSYPGLEGSSDSTDAGISAHTDFEAFTLMHQDASGLQFLPPSVEELKGVVDGGGSRTTAQREWVNAPVRPGEFVVILGDVIERFTNGYLRATPHRVIRTPHARKSIIRFNAMHPDTLIEPLPAFVSAETPARYTPVTMRRHLATTMANLFEGKGAWDPQRNESKTATFDYSVADGT